MAHENSLATPIWRIQIQYSASILLVRALLIFPCSVVPLRWPAFWKSYNLFCIQLTSGPSAASLSFLLFLLSISIFRVFGENLEMPPKKKNSARPKPENNYFFVVICTTEDIEVTDTPNLPSATPETGQRIGEPTRC